MTDYPLPNNEVERQQALESFGILDTLQEQSYDDIVLLAAQICEVPIALISFMQDDEAHVG